MRLSCTEVIRIYIEVNAKGGKTTVSDKIYICSQRQLQIMNMSTSGITIIITNCRKCSYSQDYIGNTCSPFSFALWLWRCGQAEYWYPCLMVPLGGEGRLSYNKVLTIQVFKILIVVDNKRYKI